jgi:hypothetical protein
MFIPISLFAETVTIKGQELYKTATVGNENSKNIIRNFLKSLASAYTLTVPTPIIESNNDGTVNIIINASFNLIYSKRKYKNSRYGSYMTGLKGVNFTEFWTTGIAIDIDDERSIRVSCNERKSEKIMNFMMQEMHSRPLMLDITLGQHNVKKLLSDAPRGTCMCSEDSSYAFRIRTTGDAKLIIRKVPLEDLKLISQMKAEIAYIDRKAFPRNDNESIFF